MAKHTEANKTTEPLEELWLRGMRLNDLLRLARFCSIDVGDKPVDRDDVIKILCVARQENQLADAQFRDLTRPATAFDVTSARETLEQRVDQEMQAHQQLLDETTESLRTELEPLKTYATQTKYVAGIVVLITGFVGFSIWGSLSGISEAKTNFIEVNGKLNVAEQKLEIANEKVKVLQQDLEKSLEQARTSNQNSKDMIVALSTNTGAQMIGKLNSRLDRLKSMKVYHLKPLMRELALDIESDVLTLKKLANVLGDREESPEYQFIRSLKAISEAVSNLKSVYDENDMISLTDLSKARVEWTGLEQEVSNIAIKLVNLFDISKQSGGVNNLTRLKANVYQVAAGLAIQEYRESVGSKDAGLLKNARDKCLVAIALDDSAPVPRLYNGLISSLEISQLRDQTMDADERIKAIEVAKTSGVKSYRQAAQADSSPELRAYALNGLSFLLVKTSHSYVDAANDPNSKKKDEYLENAHKLLKLAKNEIKFAKGSVASIDPVILTTQADIEILSLQFLNKLDSDESKQAKYDEILNLLALAVENGYSGYTGPMESFFKKRPHFAYLAKLKAEYKQDVCRAVGISFE